MRYNITVKLGLTEVAVIKGITDVRPDLTMADAERVPGVESFLERLTGLRFHIEEAGY